MLDIRLVIPGLPIVAPDPLAVSLGGCETGGLQLAAELVRQGHRVTIACNTPEPFIWRGVKIQDGFKATELEAPYDLFLVQREPSFLRNRGAARAAFFWVHDLLEPEQAEPLTALGGLLDRIVTVSRWQTAQYRELAPEVPEDRFLVARNGIDLELIAEATAGVERDPFRIIYASRPERGLEVLLRDIMLAILAREPRATLHIASYDNPDPIMAGHHAELRGLAAAYGDRIVWHEPLGKFDLYRLMAGSGVAIYPTPAPIAPGFAETSCITAMEAMACGLPWVSTDRGALPETVGDAGVLVPLDGAAHAGQPAVAERLAEEALRVMREAAHADRLRAAGLERAQSLGWAPVAEQFVAETMVVIEAKATSRRRAPPAQSATQRPTKVMLATPNFEAKFHLSYIKSLMSTIGALAGRGIETIWWPRCGDSLLPACRNLIAMEFVKRPELTHLLWIDADMVWSGEDVLRLLGHDLDIVAGLYRAKSREERYDYGALPGVAPDPRTGLMEVDCAGTGFMLTRRAVYEAMMAAFPERMAQRGEGMYRCHGDSEPGPIFDFFPLLLGDGTYMAEDISFCRSWRTIGGQVMVDATLRLGHEGRHVFTGDPMTMFVPAARVGEVA